MWNACGMPGDEAMYPTAYGQPRAGRRLPS
jgi:hypothetical protein